VPLICWDNIPRGAVISCPSIEKALTADIYSDRVLGVSEFRNVPAYTVQVFTGNNVSPRGDMASRSITSRLTADRPDPENRDFEHPDPIAWTKANQGPILQCLYTILLGNPRRGRKRGELTPAPTRFKEWWDLVGSAVEYAAQQHMESDTERIKHFLAVPHPTCPALPVTFKKLFDETETDDEQATSLALVISTLKNQFGKTFKAGEVAVYAGLAEPGAIAFRSAIEIASGKSMPIISSTIVSWRLKALKDAPVEIDGKVFALHFDTHHQGGEFSVAEVA
jgi:hypothetical protein